MHKWHDDNETYTKEEMANKKIFLDQLDIAVKLAEITTLSRDEFAAKCELNIGPIPSSPRFPSILDIYDKFCNFNERKPSIKSTPKKVSTKIDQISSSDVSSNNFEEIKIDSELQMSGIKQSRQLRQEKASLEAQLMIEDKINEANNLMIKSKEGKRDGSGNIKSRGKNVTPPIKGDPEE